VLAAGHTSGAVVPLVNPEFSLGLAGASVPVTILVCILGIATFGGYVVRAALQGRQPTWVAGLLVGGAVSNLIDRLAGGSVRDFLATPWVVFNIADVAVVVGLCAYLLVRLSSSALTLREVKT
jgi:lipoprotein signal peptidase